MIYISLFINPSDANGYELNNIPWVGLNQKKDTPLYCNKPNRRLIVNDNGNVDVVDDIQSNDVEVIIDNMTITLDRNLTYFDNGYGVLYSQNTYDSSQEESARDYEVNTNSTYPKAGDEYWTYCNEYQSDEPDEPDPEEPEELPSFYETMSSDLSSQKIDENVPDSIPFLVGCLGFVDGWFGTRYGKDLYEDGVINWYTESPIDLGQTYVNSMTLGEQHANEPRFRDPYFAVGYIDGYLDYLELDDYHHYLSNELGLDVLISSEKPGYDEGTQQGYNDHAFNTSK